MSITLHANKKTNDGGKTWKKMQQVFSELDYSFSWKVLNARDYGVPQNRERFIMIGNRVNISPKLIFEEIYKHKRNPFVLKDALDGLPHLSKFVKNFFQVFSNFFRVLNL